MLEVIVHGLNHTVKLILDLRVQYSNVAPKLAIYQLLWVILKVLVRDCSKLALDVLFGLNLIFLTYELHFDFRCMLRLFHTLDVLYLVSKLFKFLSVQFLKLALWSIHFTLLKDGGMSLVISCWAFRFLIWMQGWKSVLNLIVVIAFNC